MTSQMNRISPTALGVAIPSDSATALFPAPGRRERLDDEIAGFRVRRRSSGSTAAEITGYERAWS